MISFRFPALIGIAVVGSASAACAADMPTKAVRAADPLTMSWSGYYGGVTAGYNWGNARTTFTPPGPPAGLIAADQAAATVNGSSTLRPSNFTGGIEFGYNWQWTQFVSGIEADFEYIGLSKSRDAVLPTPLAGLQTTHTDVKADWLSTLRGRFGYAFGHTLVYATGGLAVANVSLNQTNSFAAIPGPLTFNKSETRAGWTIGGGAEYALQNRWTVKAEYLYVDMGHLSGTDTPVFLGVAQPFTHEVRLTDNIVRLGFNYKFN